MIALALAFVLPRPLARSAPPTRARHAETNAAIYRGELAEFACEYAEGRLTDEQYAAAREEIERRLLSDIGAGSVESPRTAAPYGASLVMVIALPLLACGLYVLLGNPEALERGSNEMLATSDDAGDVTVRRDDLIGHLARNARDGRAWVVLARMDFTADRFDEAAASYQRALAASRKIAADAGVWCEYADALAMAQGSRLAGRPRELVMRALTLNPAHPAALEMAGSAAYEQQDFTAAARYWRQLLKQLPERSAKHRELAAAIARAERLTLAADGQNALR